MVTGAGMDPSDADVEGQSITSPAPSEPAEGPDEDLGPEVTCFGDSLMDAIIGQEVCPQPPLVNWAQWSRWRRDFGFRPKEPQGKRKAFRLREGVLHRQCMLHFYGAEWRDLLEHQELDREIEDPNANLDEPGVDAPAGGGAGPAVSVSAAPAQLAVVPISTPAPSSVGVSAGSWEPYTVEELRRRVLDDIDLLTESLEDYTKRVFRAVSLLHNHQVSVPDAQLRAAVMRARYQKAMEDLDQAAVMPYLRHELQEAMAGRGSDGEPRQEVILRLIVEHTTEVTTTGTSPAPVISVSSGDGAGPVSTPLTREALLRANAPGRQSGAPGK